MAVAGDEITEEGMDLASAGKAGSVETNCTCRKVRMVDLVSG